MAATVKAALRPSKRVRLSGPRVITGPSASTRKDSSAVAEPPELVAVTV